MTDLLTGSVEERRPLTYVFMDLVGSTPLSIVLDDDVYSKLINDYRKLVSEVVRRHDGFVYQDEGDGRFVWCGWPRARRDDADRAVAMSLELLDSLDPLAGRVRMLA